MARTQTVTILFCDLVSSTERRARLGDDAADEFIQRFMAALRAAVARHDGTEVKDLGDGLMAAFPASAADAVSCASDMHRAMPELDPNYPPQLRIGISSGEVAEKGNDWSGLAVVEAARLQAAAAPGQTLASAVVRALVGTRRALRFRDVGALTLKGLPAELLTVEVVEEGTDVVDLSGASPPPPLPAQPAQPAPAERRRRGPLLAVAVIVVIALIAAGIGIALSQSSSNKHSAAGVVAPTGYTPRFESAACPSAVKTATPDATCGHLVVPQDRTQPQGKSVSLLVIREPATTGGAASAAPTIDIGGHDSVQSSPVRSHSELIQIGDRGFGEGNTPTLSCPEVGSVFTAALAHPAGSEADYAASSAAIGKCYRRLVASGVNPADYTLAASIHDVLDLVYALKLQHVDLLSGEAESAVAFGVLQAAPGAVRSVTLEDPFPPGQGFLTDPTGDLAAAFTAYVGLCTANTVCAKSYPNLESVYDSAHNQLAANPPTVNAAVLVQPVAPSHASHGRRLSVGRRAHRRVRELAEPAVDPGRACAHSAANGDRAVCTRLPPVRVDTFDNRWEPFVLLLVLRARRRHCRVGLVAAHVSAVRRHQREDPVVAVVRAVEDARCLCATLGAGQQLGSRAVDPRRHCTDR